MNSILKTNKYYLDTESPLISVIVPIYNAENYLDRTLHTLSNQTLENFEIILINDGSTDLSPVICDKFEESSSRPCIVIHKTNEGLSSARNSGLEVCSGKYVFFLDSDDVIHKNALEHLFELAERYNADIVECGVLDIYPDVEIFWPTYDEQLSFYKGEDILLHSLKGTILSVVWNKLYIRELFTNIKFPLGRIHEDEYVTPKIAEQARFYVKTNEVLYGYLQRPGSIINSPITQKRIDDILDFFEERLTYFSKSYNRKYDKLIILTYIFACLGYIYSTNLSLANSQTLIFRNKYKELLRRFKSAPYNRDFETSLKFHVVKFFPCVVVIVKYKSVVMTKLKVYFNRLKNRLNFYM